MQDVLPYAFKKGEHSGKRAQRDRLIYWWCRRSFEVPKGEIMGSWGAGSFSNDTALDFVLSLENAATLVSVIQSMHPAPLDADDASEVVAAADLIAAMTGRQAPDMPEDALKALGEYASPELKLLETARQAVERVRDESELADLWAEDNDQEWKEAIADLLQRLDPDANYVPRQIEEASPGPVLGCCFICEKGIEEEDIVDMVHEYDDGIVQSTMTLYEHRGCVEQTFEPPHWNSDGSPSEAVLTQFAVSLGLGGEE